VSIDCVTIVIKDKYNFKALNFEVYSLKISSLNFSVSLFILSQSIQSKTLNLKGVSLMNDRVGVNEISRSFRSYTKSKKN
jgi:hypothetical protein